MEGEPLTKLLRFYRRLGEIEKTNAGTAMSSPLQVILRKLSAFCICLPNQPQRARAFSIVGTEKTRREDRT